MPRHPGAYGRRPPSNKPAIRVAPFLNRAALNIPPSADYLAALGGGWRMLGNGPDPGNAAAGVPPAGAGDCVSVMEANQRRLTSTTLGVPGYWTLGQVIQFYKTQNPRFPAQDDGMDIQTALESLVANGGPDGVKALGFAKVDHGNPLEVKTAIAAGGSLAVGINVLDVNEQEFAAGEPWDYHRGASVVGGHGVLVGGYGPPASALGSDEKFITWAAETSFTDAFWAHQVEECWLVIWPEHLGSKEFLAGLDVAGFAQAYTDITGRPFPATVPPPAPPPVPDDPDMALWDVAGPWAAQHRTRPDLVTLQAAITTWGKAKGMGGDG